MTTSSFSILINGSPYGFFRPERGIRQENPFSPFLFVLAAEVLARLIKREVSQHKIKGFKLAPDLMPITNLQFADDLFIFAQADDENMERIKVIFETYSTLAGLDRK